MNQEHYSMLEREKLKFGIQIILSEFYKLLLIYLLAFLLDCIFPTFIIHLTFFLLRQVCLGYHFSNLYICLVWSAIAFPVAADYLADLTIVLPVIYLYIGTSILLLLVYTLAPKGTGNQPVINQTHRSHLRKKMNIRLLLIIGAFCLSPLKIKAFIAYGILLETVMLIVQTLKGEGHK
ncbi:accessory gene regulator ArgB-like protein [Solibacillus silvestris]|uniref:accessory gene regulator ArgB-like protein n=1 Tax=Solibacillus silvestris TaxID=76853 RepID=UPI003F7FAA60